jgi:hypothetical protein
MPPIPAKRLPKVGISCRLLLRLPGQGGLDDSEDAVHLDKTFARFDQPIFEVGLMTTSEFHDAVDQRLSQPRVRDGGGGEGTLGNIASRVRSLWCGGHRSATISAPRIITPITDTTAQLL